ncbi:Gfo/Idh/MocA family protein [Lacticaseibacillus parakribbianus]|uniref:Gfo/Idh/MocA family protein n=1 Tax=Lacticaseibacillus parakribbianus TaxID=2970927 RepID=UPI0021CAE905|nr:Gfo/Idh/MocA family oxidoreductase [Lacticaseibacillus parakribbianus]
MLNIGVIGLGNIAQKAYLPVYAQMQDQVQWYLESRDLAKVTRLANQFHMVAAGTDVAALDQLSLDAVMIHSATAVHYELVKHFLARGVNVFVDKPLATTQAQVTELYLLAAQHQKLLTVGFNRRFAPQIQALAALADKNLVQVTKNRAADPQAPEHAIFDLLIHPLDTALALAGFPEEPKARYSLHLNDQGLLEQASVTFTAAGLRGTAAINLVAGSNLEEATVATTAGISRVQDLSRLQVYTGSQVRTTQAPDWQPMLETRGFAPMIRAFVAAVAQSATNPVAPQTSRLTHTILTDMVKQL